MNNTITTLNEEGLPFTAYKIPNANQYNWENKRYVFIIHDNTTRFEWW